MRGYVSLMMARRRVTVSVANSDHVEDVFCFNEGATKEYVLRPASLGGVPNAFAIYVYGDSMEPRYFAGELLYCNPDRPLTKGCFVAIQLDNDRGMIRQYLGRSGDAIRLHQFNPELDLMLPAGVVKKIHRIVGTGNT